MGIVSVYIVLFNAVLTAGWAQILVALVKSVGPCTPGATDLLPGWFPAGHGLQCVWTNGESRQEVFDLLLTWQIFSLLEVVHAAVGIVKAKVGTTIMQVTSRIWVVFAVMYVYPEVVKSASNAFFLMSFAWSFTEVVRYSWYACKESFGAAPFVLTWMRYTFFYILYPTGVYGEQVLMLTAATAFGSATRNAILYKYGMYFIMALYVPGFPMLYFHMIAQRKKTLNPPKPRAVKPEKGLVFPKDDSDKRSTSLAGANVIGAAFRGAGDDKAGAAAEKNGKKWRFGYLKHYKKMVYTSCESAEKAYNLATGGVDFMYNKFGFIGADGKEVQFGTFMKNFGNDTPFHVGVIEGAWKDVPTSWEVPYEGKQIKGAELKAQLDAWAKYGTIEKDCAEAIKSVCENSKWMDLRGHVFVLIGTGSAMGPFPKLMELGATVVAIDIPGGWGARPAAMWERLITTARNSPGKLVFPLSKPQATLRTDADLFASAGCNLMEQPAEIRNWLLKPEVAGTGKVTIGNYTYLDGDLHVKLSLCADSIISALIDKKGKDVTVAFLCTPTDLHVIPNEARQDAINNGSVFRVKWLAEKILTILGAGLKPNVLKQAEDTTSGKKLSIVNGISVAQGPNYALAKRLQHWRAILAYRAGCTVSSSVAPSTATASVVSNITFKWAYGGMPFFKPYEIFQQETTNAVMAALLVHDVRNSDGAKNPANQQRYEITNPMELFKFESFHGGVWRSAYTVDSIGMPSVIIYFLGGPSVFLPVFYAVLSMIVYFFQSEYFLSTTFVAEMKIVLGL